jgi:hypothetical protein
MDSVIKVIGVGCWGSIVAIGAAFGMMSYQRAPPPAAARETGQAAHIEQIKSKTITIPVSANGSLEGYMRVQLAFGVVKAQVDKLPMRPDVIFVDEAYRTLSDIAFLDPRRPTRAEISKVAGTLKGAINARMETDLVKDVWLQEYNFVAAANVRDASSK